MGLGGRVFLRAGSGLCPCPCLCLCLWREEDHSGHERDTVALCSVVCDGFEAVDGVD
jgi:hypothetical protein